MTDEPPKEWPLLDQLKQCLADLKKAKEREDDLREKFDLESA
jgi:hypothetical protein